MIYSPLGQFKILGYFSLGPIYISNFSYTILTFIIGIFFFLMGGTKIETCKQNKIGRIHSHLLMFIYNVCASGLGQSGKVYFGTIFTLFICVFSANLLGLIPYSFTLTSHVVIALSFSVPVFIAMTGEAIYRHKGKSFSLFLPAGAPIGLIPLLTLIELISYIARVFSLAIRLAANLIAGHVILKIIAVACASAFSMGPVGAILSLLPAGALFIFYLLEFAVAGLQAYVFAVLCCNYLSDALSISH